MTDEQLFELQRLSTDYEQYKKLKEFVEGVKHKTVFVKEPKLTPNGTPFDFPECKICDGAPPFCMRCAGKFPSYSAPYIQQVPDILV